MLTVAVAVVGPPASGDTTMSILAEMGEKVLPTYFIKNAAKMESDKVIRHYDQHKHEEVTSPDWLPTGKITVGITAGASCPNNLIEDAIRRVNGFERIRAIGAIEADRFGGVAV